MRHRYTAVAIILVGMLLACGPKKPFAQAVPSPGSRVAREKPIVLRCGAVLDVKSGTVQRGIDIIVKGNKIVFVGNAANQLPPSSEQIDLRTKRACRD